MNRTKEMIYGILLGQAIGDAMGLAAEGMSRDMVAATYPNGVNDYVDIVQDEFRSRWPRGAWTDDTDQMFCILDSLLDKGAVDPYEYSLPISEMVSLGRSGCRTPHLQCSPNAAIRAVSLQSSRVRMASE